MTTERKEKGRKKENDKMGKKKGRIHQREKKIIQFEGIKRKKVEE